MGCCFSELGGTQCPSVFPFFFCPSEVASVIRSLSSCIYFEVFFHDLRAPKKKEDTLWLLVHFISRFAFATGKKYASIQGLLEAGGLLRVRLGTKMLTNQNSSPGIAICRVHASNFDEISEKILKKIVASALKLFSKIC